MEILNVRGSTLLEKSKLMMYHFIYDTVKTTLNHVHRLFVLDSMQSGYTLRRIQRY